MFKNSWETLEQGFTFWFNEKAAALRGKQLSFQFILLVFHLIMM